MTGLSRLVSWRRLSHGTDPALIRFTATRWWPQSLARYPTVVVERLAPRSVLHDGVTMWDAVRVLDAFPLPARHEVLTHDLPEEDGKYDSSYGAPRCVLVANPRLPQWLETLLGQPLPLSKARAPIRYAQVSVSGLSPKWTSG